MTTVPFHYIDLRAFAYATEDDKRVEAALRTVLPPEYPIEREESEGYHGDRILVLSSRVETADDMRVVLDHIRELPTFDRIPRELDDRVTENCELYLSIDKQAAFRGKIRDGDGIKVRAKIEAYPAKKSTAIAAVEPFFASDS